MANIELESRVGTITPVDCTIDATTISSPINLESGVMSANPHHLDAAILQVATYNRFRSAMVKPLAALIVVTVVLCCIMLLQSFDTLEFYEAGFKMNTLTGSVYTSPLYEAGLHYTGLGYSFRKFRISIHTETFHNIWIFNKEKLEVTLTCTVLYELRIEDLDSMHHTYGPNYEALIRSTALAAIKGAATNYAIHEYRLERQKVKRGLADAVALALGGICCRRDCVANKCARNCRRYTECTIDDKGYFVALKYLLLHMVDITPEQGVRFLKQVMEQEQDDTEKYIQEEMVIRKNTDLESSKIYNDAIEVMEEAISHSSLMTSLASIASNATIEDARDEGFQSIFVNLNITNENEKNSLMYVRSLRNNRDANMYVGFGHMIAKH